ncbi:MAG: endolytic transglycosylase MltG [Clostridia bacterium]|nr:endolytic transglycosylase MltG [Clostridia bacterium]
MKKLKNYKTKIVAVILVCVTLISLCGCKPKPHNSPDETTASNTVTVMFPEGSTVSQMALLLEENGVCSASDFMAEADNPMNLEGFSFEIPNPDERSFLLEGYLFPDTYEFYKNESASSAIKRFLKNTESKLTEEIRTECDKLGFTLDEILALASIIQEEAGNPAEMGKVSSVLHNRLQSEKYPRLQCDVATFYLRDYVKPYVDEARYEELMALYNTYNCDGLPAGPITNSGIDAVKAALFPEKTDWYFFVTDSNGIYYYAETWSEHLENCETAGL